VSKKFTIKLVDIKKFMAIISPSFRRESQLLALATKENITTD
jgi:hypothetical protein